LPQYDSLRGCIHNLAQENGIDVQCKFSHILNRIPDRARAEALQTYSTQRALDI